MAGSALESAFGQTVSNKGGCWSHMGGWGGGAIKSLHQSDVRVVWWEGTRVAEGNPEGACRLTQSYQVRRRGASCVDDITGIRSDLQTGKLCRTAPSRQLDSKQAGDLDTEGSFHLLAQIFAFQPNNRPRWEPRRRRAGRFLSFRDCPQSHAGCVRPTQSTETSDGGKNSP